MRKVKSCGIICFRRKPELAFLLMRHSNRFDLPKGHINEGESERDCALREFEEETSIPRECVELDNDFRYEDRYYPHYRRFGSEQVEKTAMFFLGWLVGDADVLPTEHPSFSWMEWRPPHRIQDKAVDPLLQAADDFWNGS